jgi:hypothetical protein
MAAASVLLMLAGVIFNIMAVENEFNKKKWWWALTLALYASALICGALA